MLHRLLMIIALTGLVWPTLADTIISGKDYRVVDGDTITLSGYKIRLIGIDAPERQQQCQRDDGSNWACGKAATALLTELLDASDVGVSCIIEGKDKYSRLLGVCYAGSVDSGVDVQRALVQVGLVVAEYDPRYRADEKRAKSEKRGLWAGQFVRPKKWRMINR